MEEKEKDLIVNNPTDTLYGVETRVETLVNADSDEIKTLLADKNAFGAYKETKDETSTEEVTSRTLSPGMIVLKRFFRSKLSMTGLIMLIVLFVFSFLGPLLPFSCIWKERESDESKKVTEEYAVPIENPTYGKTPVYIVTYSEPTNYLKPSWDHLLGTDDKGFDVFSRLMYGGRVSLTVGFVVIILETLLGVLLGGLAGYFGRWVDQVIMRIVDIFNCVPTLPMMMIIGVALDAKDVTGPAKLYIMMAMLTFFGWAGTRTDIVVKRAGFHAQRRSERLARMEKNIQALNSQRNAAAYSVYDVRFGRDNLNGSNARIFRNRTSRGVRNVG